MPLPMNYSRNLPRNLDLGVLRAHISTGEPVVVKLHYDDAPDDMAPSEARAWAEQQAGQLAYFLWDYVDPLILDALVHWIVQHSGGYEVTEYDDRRGNPYVQKRPVTERVVQERVEVPLRFYVLDPAHPCYGKTGEMLYAEGEDGPYYLWIDNKAIRVEKHQIEKKV